MFYLQNILVKFKFKKITHSKYIFKMYILYKNVQTTDDNMSVYLSDTRMENYDKL